MANKKNVETDKKNTEIKNKKSNELEQKKPTQRKKRRLHSHLKVNIPLFQSLMMILPSLAKHATAESIDNSSDAADQVTANNVTEKDVTDDHSKADSSAVAHQEAQTSDSDVNSSLSASHAPHGSSSHLIPSHHLSTLSHPQVHYIPSVSMPTISSGSNGQPTHSNAPTTPALPVTFMPEVIKGTYGELHVDANGQYTFILNPNSPQYILLNQHQPGTDHFALHLSNGSSIIVQIPVTGKQDTPSISGDLTGVVTEDHNIDSQGLLHANGKIDVIDPDQNESSVTPEVISGKYGSLTIDADGHWQYQVDNSLSNVQALTAATSLHESFTIHTKDGTPQTIDMTIGGNDDNAVITGVDAGTVTEDLTTQVQGQLSVTDSDLGEDHFQASQVTSNFGTLSITKDGAWTYNLDNNNPVVQGIGQGSTATDTITVHSADGTAHQVTVTINGTNDNAVITSSAANSPSSFFAIGKSNGSSQVTEDKDLTVSGQLNITDIDSKEAHFSNSDLKGTLGTLHLKDNGDWTYDLDNKNPQVQALGQGSTTTDIITIHSADGTPHQIAITVNGTNDKAVISGTSAGVVTEESQLQTSGKLAVTDVDTGEAHFSNTDIVGSFGTLHLTDTGSWTYDLDNTNPNVQSLGKGATATDTITVHSADGTPHQVTITVNGTNDKATVSSATVTIDETDKAVTTSGTLTSADVDNPDNAFAPDSIVGSNGNLNIDADGNWTFTANSVFNQLNVGDKVEETFTVNSVDGTPSTIKITINGTNDKATVSSATVAIDETDKAVTTSGTLTSTDVDNPDNTFTPDFIIGTNGNLNIDAHGQWIFTANSAFNQLNVGDKVEETFTVSSIDGTPSTIKVTINGTNDKATVSSASVAIDETDKAATTSGTLTSTDIDNPDNAFTPDSITGTNGDLTIDANGHWVFIAHSAFNQLNVGDKVEETFTVSSIDGTSSTIKVTINGTNDKATVSSATVAIDETDKAVTTSGTLISTDVDNPDNAFTPNSIIGANGNLNIDANGHWTFTANSTFNQLNVGDKVEETFTVNSIDGTPSTIKITINGTNDKATVSSATVAIDETDKAVTTSGTLISTDVDNPDNAFTPNSIIGANGNLNIDANGHWTFTANSAFNQLNVGDRVEETFTVSSVDGTPSTIKVTINGTNDKATVSSATVAIDETDKAVTTSGTLTSTDVDNPDNTFTPDSISGTNGNLNIDTHGQWTFTANSAFHQLNVGDKVEETFTVSSIDGTPSTIKVTINGTNDKATVSTATVSVDETDKAVITSGTLTSTDVDNPDNTFTPDSISGTNGNLTIDANGHWVFTANSAFNQLNVGDKVEETFTVSSVDGTTSTIKVTINGTNDKATVSSATVAIDETDKAVTTSGTLISTDVDNPDNAFTPDSIIGANGNLSIDANGHWNFTANSAFNQLNVGDKVEETFTVNSIDGTPSTIKVTINGTDDAATVSTATVAIDETDKAVTTSGMLTSTDVDNPDNTFTPDSIVGANGALIIDANGHWTFTANSAFNHLNVGDKVDETFTVSSVDGTPSIIKVTINGTNDAATVSTATVSVDETDKAATTSGTLTSTDIDNPDNTFTPDSIVGSNGDLTIDANGHWTFTANSTFNQLNVGDKVEETFTVSSVDGTSSTIKVTINGTNDAATVSSATVAIDETDKAVTTSGTLTSTDIDNPDNAFTPDSISGTNGDLTIDANGHWVFTANSAFNQLNVGDKVKETFTVNSVDGTPSTIKVTINGTNDKATVSSATVAIDETDKAVTTSGTLTSIDVDNPDNAFTPDSITGTNGNLTIGANGQWAFTANSAFNQLNVGDKVEETFMVSSVDGTTSTIKVTINGTNDKATISTATVSVDETDKAVTTSGTLTSADVDNPNNAFTPDSITGTNGDLTIDANGHWVFTASSAFNQLNVGDKVEETFTVSSVDGTPSTVKVTINGTNDQATVSSATVAIDETDKAVTTSGTLTSTDVDNPDNIFTPDSIVGSNGDLTIDANGHWTFTANSTFNQLNVGDKVEETFTVSSVDGTPSTIKVTINGTNDVATVSSATVAIDETDKAVTTSGTLTSTDVDNPDNTFTPDSIIGTNGNLNIDAHGQWVFTANSAFNQLNVGDKVEETFTVSSVDGTPSTIKITINGTNDKATVSSANVVVDETDTAVTTSGTLTSTDVDNPDNTFTPDSISGTNGNLNIDANGHWTFTANSAFNQLNVGDKVEETFTVNSVDGTPSTIKVTINGTNDKATVSSANVVVDETDTAVTTSGTLTSTDVDNPDNTFTPDSISGTNGNLNIDANGHWTFTANSAFNQLNVGDKVEETFTVNSVDGTPSTIKVTINGTNDAATVSSATVAVDETDKAVTTSGTLTSTDVDNPDNTFTPDSISGTNGNLNIDANGHWTFTANSAFNQLNVGDKVEETFTVNSVDGTPSTIKVTINGTNDAATVSSATVAVDETDKAVTTSGTLISTDVDNPDNAFTPNSIIGANGNLNIDANGHWTFTANSAFNQLNVGDKVEETFTVNSIDGTPSTIKVTINGTNDKATVSSATVAIDETDKAVTTSGTLTSTDVDNPDNAFTPDSISGTNGDLTIDANGHWTFTANSAFSQLNVGDKVEETFTVNSIDGTPSTIKVTINGTNDKATVSSATVAIDETDKAVTTSGTLTSTDVDNPDNAFTPDSISGTNGDLTIDANGHWTFTANSAFSQLNVGDKVEETFTVNSIDGTPSTIKVTINGTNDKATVSTATVSVDETDKAVTTSGTLTSTDVDNPDNTFTPDSIVGSNGDLTIDANSHWTFTANSAFNQLNVGDKVEETFTINSVDGTPSTIKITINGTNDKATVSSATVAIDETDKAVTTSGTLTSIDVDNPDNAFTPDSITGTNGALTIDANGHWIFTANRAFNQLNVGDKVEETFTVSSVDGTPSTIKVTINGTNDKATVSSATVAIDETDTAVTTSGTLTSTDVDNPDNAFTPDSIVGANGDLTIDANGHWTFTANSAFNQLNVGDKVEETFTVSSVDGTPSTIKVTINGTNDKATVSSATVAIDETDKAVTTSGTLTSTDVDNPDNTFTAASLTGTNGDLTIDATGHWVFTANSAFNQLNVGDKVEETFTVSSVDGTPSTIKVTINGTNDAATVSSATVAIDETDKAVTTSGTLTSTDIDNPDNTFTPDSISGTNGNLNIDANGHWVFTANSAFNQFNVGDKVEETFTVSSVDGTASTIKVTINGTNDAATVSSAAVAIDETDKAVTTSGTLTSTDVDNPDNAFTPDSIIGANGNLNIDANGRWTFTANSAFNQLNVGDKAEETFTVSSVDGTPSTIKVTINGTNDKATVSSANVAVDETDTAVTTSGTLTSTDVDNPDNTFTPDSISGTNGNLTIDVHGHWVFTANSAFNQLNVGDKVEETFTVSSIDGTPSTIKVTINGTNDKATVSTATVSVDETDKAVITSGTLTSTDVDNPDNTFTPDSITGTNGDLTIDANGHWTFTANSAFNQLNVGDKVEETFTISSIDGTPSTIRVTINGTNDKPTIAAQSHSVTEDGQLLQGQMVGSDIDNGAQLTYSVANPVDGLTLNKDGSYIFDPANSTYQQLADKQTQTITIPVTVTDEHNSSSTENLTIIITGTGDSAIIGGVDTGSVIEKTAGDNMSPDFAHSGMATLGNSVLSADGQLTIVDPDKGEQGFASHTNAYNYHGTYGDLILNPDGSWHYVADAGSVSHIGGRPTTRGTAIDQLGKGDTLTDTITVHSIDGTTHDIVITINGSNDRPYCSSEVQLNSGKEDAVQTITTSELLSNSVDVDANDAGKLSVANLHADHGSIRDNHDGTFTFTPNHNYNGNIHFTYDVVDAHSGATHTGANTTITGTPDQAVITEVTTGSVTEDGTHATHNNGITTELAYGQLQVIDPDSGENKFQYSQFGETSIHDPFGGMLRIDSAGNWGYSVDNAALQHLGQGQTETVVYRVHSYDGTAYDLHIDVTGTNDAPTVNKVVLSNGTEDTHYQMQASQFGFTDIDTKDTLHSISITDLPPATQGKFVLDGHDISSGQSIATADISKLQFVPAQDFNGDVQFKYTVNDGHVNSQKATNTLHIDAVSDTAKITGTDTGDVHEGHTFTAPDGSMSGSRVNDRSPDHQHHNTGKLWNDQIHTKGHLNIHDADSGEAHAQNGVYHGHYGQIILQENGDWSYYASIGQDSTGRAIDKLGQGQNLTDTITIKSADGTAHNIVITIHGSNDRPYCSSEVQLNAGTEDTRQTITIGQLLHNTVDVDNNDTGLLTVENLHADHGSIAINSDGSFSFTPEKNYNGNVHFSYDVRDAHGGVTHTGAITSLGAINDNPDNIPVVDSVTEDTDTHHIINLLAGATDVDGDALSISQIQASFEGSTGKLPQGVTIASDGHSLIIDSHAQVFQHLRVGEKSDVVVHYMIDDNHGGQTPAIATITIVGTDDKAGLTSNIIQMSETEAVDSAQHTYKGSLQLVDPDTGDNTQFLFGGRYIGQHYSPGSLNIFPDGSYQFRLQGALNRHANDDIQSLHAGESTDFPYEIKTSDGQTLTIMVRVTGEDSNAQIHVSMPNSLPANQSVTEEHFVPASTTNLYAGGRLHVVDPDHDQSYLQAETINTAHHGQFKISADGGWNYTIDNSIDEVQKLGAGESFTETHTVHSLDGTASQLLIVTVQGTNDAPLVSAQVKLAPGIEDTDIQLNKSDLLSNATDIDHNDIGHLNITNLVADHGVIVDNKDGTFNFHPEPNYNGQVHFSYDVIDGHGGVTHTGASTTLAAVNDAAVFSVDDTGSVKEDVHVQGDSQHTVAVSGVLIVSDPDAGESEFVANRNVHAVSDQFGGDLSIGRAGDWTYSVPNNNLNRLAEGEKHQVTYEVVSRGGDKHQIVITVVGTNDEPILSVTQTTPTTGTLTETDVDVKDMHTFSVVSSTGQFGSLSVDPDTGAYVYTANSSVAGMTYNSATHTYHGTDVFEVKVADNHGGESSKFITFDTNGHVSVVPGQQPTISTTVPVNPLITTTQPSLPTRTNTPPSNAVTLDLAASSDTGISDTDNVTKETTPTITGHTDIPYSQVTVYDGSTLVGHAVSDASGQYSVAVSSLSDGDHNLSAKALAPSSVQPATSSLLSVHVDTVVAPLTIGLTHDTGSNNSDLITSDGALTIGGQEAGSTVEYSIDNGHTWTSSFTPQQGSNTVSMRQTDTAGNVSTNTSLTFTLDNTITAPTVSLRNDTGPHSVNTPDLITKDSQLSIQTEAGAKVEYSNDGGHTWTAVFNPVEGVNNLQVRQTDIAGNLSPVTNFSFTLDTTPGTVTVNPISQDNALNAAENNQPLVITGTTSNIDPGDVVYVVVGNNHFYDATVKSDGSWSLTLSASVHQNILASDHDYPIQVGTVDTAGNSTPRISTHLLVDTQNPIPHITVDSVTQDNVLNALESGQSIPITGTVTGDYHAGDTVSLKINGTHILSLTGTINASGHFSIPVDGRVLEHANIHTSYASGQAAPIHSIEATIQTTDVVGNVGSATTGSQVFTVDTQIHIGIQTDPITADNVINSQESNSSVDVTGSVSGDFNVGDIVTLNVNGAQHTGAVDSQGHYSIAVPGSELTADADQKIEASIAVTDSAGNSAHTTTDVVYQVDTQVSVPTITFENTGADNLYSKAEIARGHANTITATVTPPGDAKIGEHLVVNGQDHVLDAHTLQHGIQIEVHPGSNMQATMTDEHGNTAGSQGFAASAIPEPIVVRPPSGSHQVSGTLGIPPQLPSLTPVPTTQHGWRIHLPNGQYVTSHHGQYGTLTIDPQTGDLHYQEQANVHTGPHGSASGIGQHEDKFEVALQGTNQDEVVAHVNIQILSHGPGNSGKLNIGTEVVDMTITPIAHASHPAPPPPVLHDEPDMASQADFTVTQSDDSYLDLTQHTHQEPDQKTSHHGAAAYLDALGIKPDATSTTVHDQPADMDIVLAQVDHQDATTHDQAHLDMSDALEHHDANINHNQDDEHHLHDIDGLPDIDPNS